MNSNPLIQRIQYGINFLGEIACPRHCDGVQYCGGVHYCGGVQYCGGLQYYGGVRSSGSVRYSGGRCFDVGFGEQFIIND